MRIFSRSRAQAASDDDAPLIRPWHQGAMTPPRMLLALKAATACTIAWIVAPHMPGVVAQYPFYAPLGALSVMYPTLLGSMRTGVQTILGLALGMLLALVVLLTDLNTVITLFIVIVVGTILAGVRKLGVGADYIPMTALFVLVIGGPNADDYSVGYLVQMTTGAVIGLVVHLLIAPPVDIRSASLELGRAEKLLMHYLRDVAREVRTPGSTTRRDWVEVNQQLAQMTTEVRGVVQEQATAMKGNPRMLLPNYKNQDPRLARLIRVEYVAFYMRNLTDVLRRLFAVDGSHMVVPAEVSKELERALRAVAEVLRVAWRVETDSLQGLTTAITIVPLTLDEQEKDEVAILARRARARITDLSQQLENLEIRNTWDHWWLVSVSTDLERILQTVTAHGASNPPPKPKRTRQLALPPLTLSRPVKFSRIK
ncbi:FUSC family protein [Kocuria sp.]|uniref:FUSC family protein n=1 Tax=Kocuria sp. TaxID=1871328 RepID=UPI0026DFD95D|nr:FUSC family protein [Kocuria sp.]MDO5618189.1 FUSC family protein [Kocuria sp.]